MKLLPNSSGFDMNPYYLNGFNEEMQKLAAQARKDQEERESHRPTSVGHTALGMGTTGAVAGGGLGYSSVRSHITGDHKVKVKRGPRKLGFHRVIDAYTKGNSSKKLTPSKLLANRPTRIKRLVEWEKRLIKKSPSIAAAALLTGAAGAAAGVAGGRWIGKERQDQWKARYPGKKKTSSLHEPRDPNKRQDIAEKVVGITGAGLGVGALASLFSPSGPASSAVVTRAHTMAQDMGLRNVPAIHSQDWWHPIFGLNAWFDQGAGPLGRHINLPSKVRDAVMAHEIGHALNDQALRDIGPAASIPYNFIQGASRLGSGPVSAIMAVKAAREKDPTWKPGLTALAVAAPMLAEEAAASIRAGAFLINQHGLKEGLIKTLPLVPAFATYATVAAAPLAITAWRKHRRAQALKEQEARRLA